jgi:hypothetical protein
MSHSANLGKLASLDSARAFLVGFALPWGGRAAVAVPLGAAVCCSFALVHPVSGLWGQLARYTLVAALAGGVAHWPSLGVFARRRAAQRGSSASPVPGPADGGHDGAQPRPEPLAPVPGAANWPSTDFAAFAGAWLSREANASRVAALLIDRLPAIISFMEQWELWDRIVQGLARNLGGGNLGPVVHRAVRQAVDSREFDLLLGSVIDGVLDLAFANWERLQNAVERENLWWMPRSMDRRITNAILRAFEGFAEGLRSPDSEGRLALVALVEQLADQLAAVQERIADAGMRESGLAANPLVQGWLNSAWTQARQEILQIAAQSGGEFAPRASLTLLLAGAAHVLAEDAALRQVLNQFIGDFLGAVAETSR